MTPASRAADQRDRGFGANQENVVDTVIGYPICERVRLPGET